MSDIEKIQLFEQKKIRTAWDEEKQEWFFSIVDVCGVLTGQPDYDLAKNYWKVLKHRLIKEGNESVTKCNQLKLPSPKDGKRYAEAALTRFGSVLRGTMRPCELHSWQLHCKILPAALRRSGQTLAAVPQYRQNCN